MVQKMLLPHKYKKAGVWMTPSGLATWVITQSGFLDTILPYGGSWQRTAILVISFFSFLIGLYLLVFSKECNEDEYINNLRLKSFQTAAFGQLAFFIVAFIYMAISGNEPANDGQLELFLILSIFFFWVWYISHFNLTMLRMKNKMHEE